MAENVKPMDDQERETIRRRYQEMIGVVPPPVDARIEMASKLDPEALRKAEALRSHALSPAALDAKTVQLIATGIQLALRAESGVRSHARAALRAGASLEELHAVVVLAAFYCGIGTMNLGGSILKEVAGTVK